MEGELVEIVPPLLDSVYKHKKNRKTYTREEKIQVVTWHYANGGKVYRTAKHFSLNTKTILRWIKDEEKIRDSKPGSARATFSKTKNRAPRTVKNKLDFGSGVVLGRYSNRY